MNKCCESNVIFLGKREYFDGTDTHRLWICTKCDGFIVTINGMPVESESTEFVGPQMGLEYEINYLYENENYAWIDMVDTVLEYQLNARKTLLPIADLPTLAYLTIGLSDEAGEVAGKIKKLYRDSNGIITPELRQAIKKELGDVLWYLTNLCTEFQLPLADVMDDNIAKLFDRQERGMIQGNGDNR